MSSTGVIEIYSGNDLSYDFETVNGEVYVEMGSDRVRYHLQVPDYEASSNLARLPLPQQLMREETVRAVFVSAHMSGNIGRSGKAITGDPKIDMLSKYMQQSNNFPAEVRLEKPDYNLGIRRTHAIWVTRVDSRPPALAA